MMPHHNVAGFSSPQSHPENAFFKPKINAGERGLVQTASGGHRGVKMPQKSPVATSPKAPTGGSPG